MPRTVISIKAEIRDHSMSIPVPENTIRHGIPNACNQCHKDRNAEWTLQRMNEWYTPNSRQKLIRRADAFAAARRNDPGSVTDLLAIVAEPAEGPLTRGNAVGYLARFASDPRAFPALNSALTDAEPMVRALAAYEIVACRPERSIALPGLVRLLADPAATVRMSALVTLVTWGYRELPGEDGERLNSARLLYEARAALGADDAGQEVAAGKFYILSAEPDRAIAAFRGSLRLDPATQAQYLLAGAYAEKSDLAEARKILEAIPPNDPQYEKAQRLLKVILAQSPH
jgi:tetratricopeptide (TPR) repeat protein